MIKEELYKEAEEYVSKYQGYGWQPHRGSATFEAMLDCYIHGAESREKRIAELEEERDKYRNMVFDQKEQLRKAEDIIRSLYFIIQGRIDYEGNIPLEDEMYRAKQFLNKVS